MQTFNVWPRIIHDNVYQEKETGKLGIHREMRLHPQIFIVQITFFDTLSCLYVY